jgi:hypothetical protein
MKYLIFFLIVTLAIPSWAETWQCRQLRDVLVGPPYYVDQEETDLAFDIEVGNSEIRVLPDNFQVFQCVNESCRDKLSANDVLIKGENRDARIILSAVGANLGLRATYSITSKPSVGETMIQMGVCNPAIAN